MKQYTTEQMQVLAQFDELASKLGSQNKACGVIGISASIMSQIKNESYRGDVDQQFSKLASYFRTKADAAASPAQKVASTGYVPTSISVDTYNVIRNCQLQGGLAVACGSAGIGKTMAAKQFVDDHRNDAIYLAINPVFNTIKSTLRLLCTKLNVSEKTNNEMWLGIASKLRDGMVIIIDEAQHLPTKTIEVLRALPDYFADRGQTLGVVFIGNMETVSRFGGRKTAEFHQIANRTRQRKVYMTSNILQSDIELLFPEADDPKVIAFLLEVSRTPHAIRGAINLYKNAADNRNTTYEGIVAMAKYMEMAV